MCKNSFTSDITRCIIALKGDITKIQSDTLMQLGQTRKEYSYAKYHISNYGRSLD